MYKYAYKLENHLRILCEENKEFQILWDTWYIIVKTI